MQKQTTIKKEIICSGVGLHSGKNIYMTLVPQPANSGVRFEVFYGGRRRILKLNPKQVVGTGLATILGDGNCHVSTIEHLLATFQGLQIDNVLVRIEGQEVPIMDGSATQFVSLIRSVGLEELDAKRHMLRIRKPVRFEKDGKYIEAAPYNGFRVEFTINFDHELIGTQTYSFELNPFSFAREIAPARTFGFLRDVAMLKEKGLALGGSLENVVVLDGNGIVNPEGLRFENELVRHKILDFIGDMAMIGLPLQGDFTVYCSGHGVNNEFLRFLQANRQEYLQDIVPPAVIVPTLDTVHLPESTVCV